MAENESVEFFLRFLKERFEAFRDSLSEFLQVLSNEDREAKIAAARHVLGTIDDLKRAMSAHDHPSWIEPLETRIQWYIDQNNRVDAGLTVLKMILQLTGDIESQDWRYIDEASDTAIDFAAVYENYYRESRVPELFDELVAQLEAVIETGEIDSIRTIRALEKLIATIRKNARGDYFSTRGAWEFTQVFFRNLFVEVLETIPGLKQSVKAIRKTMSELDLEMTQVHDQVKQKLRDSITDDLPMLDYKPLALPAPESDTDTKDAQAS